MMIQHPLYARRMPQWERCRDAYEGVDSVKAKGPAYLPQLSSAHGDYHGYLMRAPFYPAFSRTVDGLIGAVIRKEPTIHPSERWLEVTGGNHSVAMVAECLLREVMICGRGGILVDIDDGRLTWRLICAEDILSWEVDRGELVDATIRRKRWKKSDHGEIREVEETYRYEKTPGGIMVSFDPGEGGASLTRPLMLGSGMGLMRIPLAIADLPSESLEGLAPPKPPMLDLVDLVYQHYRAGADLEHATHWVALPTPYVTGRNPPPDGMVIGSSQLWYLGADATAGMLEVSGAGLESLAKSLMRKQGQMAAIGASILAGEPSRVAETAEAVRLKSHSETALLHGIAHTVERAIEDSMRMSAEWMQERDSVSGDGALFEFSRDWISSRLPSNDVSALLASLQAGAISHAQFISALVRGEWLMEGAMPESTMMNESDERIDEDEM